MRLTVKPTKFRDDQVLVGVRVGGGLTTIPGARQSPGWAGSALLEGGLAQDLLRGHGARPGLEDLWRELFHR